MVGAADDRAGTAVRRERYSFARHTCALALDTCQGGDEIQRWSHRMELHHRPLAYEASTLLSELLRHLAAQHCQV